MYKESDMKVVYLAKNLITGDSYIGADSKWPKRKRHHQHLARRGGGYYFHSALSKYGEAAFEWTILETVECNDLYERERYWISEITPTYNLTTGGEGRCAPQTEETKKKISEKLKGNKNGVGGKARLGKPHDDNTKHIISEKMKVVRNTKKWSTKKKNGDKILKGGVHEWTKEERASNAKKVGSMLWWNNGIKNVRSMKSPGIDYIRGRI